MAAARNALADICRCRLEREVVRDPDWVYLTPANRRSSEVDELVSLLEQVLSEINPKLRGALAMRVNGMTFSAIASELHVSRFVVSRAFTRLRAHPRFTAIVDPLVER
jgi:hypothetical protein